MKKETVVFLLLLIFFISILSGVLIGRFTGSNGIQISYETGDEYPTDATNPADQILATIPVKKEIGKININTATKSQLTSLPNIGDVLAQRIIDYRTKNGPFQGIEDIMQVDGIGQTRFAQLQDEITVG